MKINKSYLKNKGFTLIELLVVIAIVGILSAVVMAALNEARHKAADSKAMSDIKSFQNAVELYVADHNGDAPCAYSDTESCAPTSAQAITEPYLVYSWGLPSAAFGYQDGSSDHTLSSVLSQYISELPTAPRYPGNGSGTCNTSGTDCSYWGYTTITRDHQNIGTPQGVIHCGGREITKYAIILYNFGRPLNLPKMTNEDDVTPYSQLPTTNSNVYCVGF